MRIPENLLEEILGRVNIVEIIAEHIPLKRAGRNFKANCPFHHEKTPSFMVSPERQIYHCFGCGESGNAFKFLMRYERLDFPEAVEVLARKAGVILPEIKKEDSATAGLYTQLFKVNEQAAAFFKGNLKHPSAAAIKKYLLDRGVKQESIDVFGIGYAPDKWDGLINFLRSESVALSLMEKAGLILAKQRGGYYDRFRQRLIFPITDVKSRVLGFGGRILSDNKDKALAKYINSPETPIYTKGRNLYGLNLARDAIREDDFAVVVEGYLDFIIPYQEGVRNIVASLGTALTPEQIRLLRRYTHNVVIIYDADDAGQMAALRALDIFIEEGMNVRVVSLPEGLDPDLFIRQRDIALFKELIRSAETLFDYKLKVLKSRYNIKDPQGKAGISQEMLPTISKFRDSILKAEYIKKFAEHLDVAEFFVLEELGKIKDGRKADQGDLTSPRSKADINPTEKLLIKLMLEETRLIDYIRQHLEPADFQDKRATKMVSIMFDLISEGKKIEANKIMGRLEDQEMLQCISESVFDSEVAEENKTRIVDDCIRLIKNKRVISTRQRLQTQIHKAEVSGDQETVVRLREEFCNLIKRGKKQ